MGYSSALSTYFLFLVIVVLINVIDGKPLAPAFFIFGDSSFDVGNNNNLPTAIKGNFPPYGRDFMNHIPTGRFCNGKLAIDFASESLGFISYQPAYLNLYMKGKNLLNGANFASSASGYHDSTAKLYNSISLNQQLELYKGCQNELMKIAGRSDALSIIFGAVYLVGTGTGDFLLNYYMSPLLYKAYTPDQFSDILVRSYANFIQNLYALGARKIVVTTLTAIGCLPAAITLFGPAHSNKCVVKINNVAINFNRKLNSTSVDLRKVLPHLNLVVLDIYQPLYNLVTKPSKYGFSEARKSCFGTHLLERNSIFSNKNLIVRLCANASKYVFWDDLHPTEAANKYFADTLILEGISVIYTVEF